MVEQNENCIEITAFTLPKSKENIEDIQDAFSFNDDRTIVAIADGASTSLYPRQWADILVKKFCDYRNDSIEDIYQNWQEWLKPLQEEWFNYFQEIQQDSSTQWYLKPSQYKDCASSTFLGLKLHYPDSSGKNYYECVAIGDSCLFHIKSRESKVWFFPMKKSQDFTSVTDAFHSSPRYHNSNPKLHTDFYEKDDIFLLTTDALAEWIFKELESQGKRWQALRELSDKNEFEKLIGKLRSDKLIKNDDTTLVRLKVISIPQKKVQNISPSVDNSVSVSSIKTSSQEQPHSTTPPSSEQGEQNRISPLKWLIQLILGSSEKQEVKSAMQPNYDLPKKVISDINGIKKLIFFCTILIVSISSLNLLTNIAELITLRKTIQKQEEIIKIIRSSQNHN